MEGDWEIKYFSRSRQQVTLDFLLVHLIVQGSGNKDITDEICHLLWQISFWDFIFHLVGWSLLLPVPSSWASLATFMGSLPIFFFHFFLLSFPSSSLRFYSFQSYGSCSPALYIFIPTCIYIFNKMRPETAYEGENTYLPFWSWVTMLNIMIPFYFHLFFLKIS